MAGLKEIKRRLKSVQNTKKITYAMKLVSAAKLRKAQEAVINARFYTDELYHLLTQLILGAGATNVSHPLMTRRTTSNNFALLVVGGQRGLCGSYNSSLHKQVEAFFKQKKEAHPEINLHSILLGRKPSDYYRRRKYSFIVSYEELSENANTWPIEEVSQLLEDGFLEKKYDEVWMVYTRFKSAISQVATVEKLLPLDDDAVHINTSQSTPIGGGATLFEPSQQEVFTHVIPRILRSKVRQACLDAKASETASRMTAMDAATKNAGDLVKKLSLAHNKLRQQRITAELLDIVGGAEAVQ